MLLERADPRGPTMLEFALKYGIGYGSMNRLNKGYRPQTMAQIEKCLEML